VIDIRDALKIKKAILVGHSTGGMVAAHLAERRSDRIAVSVWIGPILPDDGVAKIF
jgi:pimeloyl-ACP methyl ester carboxylesterase